MVALSGAQNCRTPAASASAPRGPCMSSAKTAAMIAISGSCPADGRAGGPSKSSLARPPGAKGTSVSVLDALCRLAVGCAHSDDCDRQGSLLSVRGHC